MSKKMDTLGGLVAAGVTLLLISCSAARPPETRVFPASYAAPGPGARNAGSVLTRAAAAQAGSRGQPAYVDGDLERHAYVLANRARREEGLEHLEIRLDLIDLARKHALDMARRDYFAHHSPEGIGPGDRATLSGVKFRVFAENLARIRNASTPAKLAVDGWLGSPGHRRNLLDEGAAGYRYTGVGAARAADGTVLISQVFLR